MYLTGGEFKGYKIEIPKTARPTLSKVRESVFNMLDNIKHSDSFLDMFAGSAIMGLEACSRGYKVAELEINRKTADIIKQNYLKLGLNANITICNALKYKEKTFDVIYIDPPWQDNYKPIITHAIELLNDNGLIIIEHDKIIDFSEFNLEQLKSKKYGRCLIDILRKN
ncbi:MAG: RsmD family RNA methyltransferase [Candidatus Gastranaerophilales bacterium]|nr:RsmD family RNA methyltransferase [Candidatus Gastranaerophilales bacterium]